MTKINAAYRYWRTLGYPARQAIAKARRDVAEGTARYPSSAVKAGYGTSGKPFAAFGERHMRWIENPSAAGLRFVGYADDLAGLRHTGWYTDDDGCGETVRGVVYRMVARNDRARYVAGYEDPYNGGPACCLSFDTIHEGEPIGAHWEGDGGAREAAYAADGIAERMAEEERGHNAAFHAGNLAADLEREAADIRADALALISEIKSHKVGVCDAPAIVAALRERLESMLETIRECREKRDQLRDDYGHHPAFNDCYHPAGA